MIFKNKFRVNFDLKYFFAVTILHICSTYIYKYIYIIRWLQNTGFVLTVSDMVANDPLK